MGGGAVGERKVQDLRVAGARVTVVSLSLTPALAELAAADQIRYRHEDFSPDQLQGMVLVLAATDDPKVNARVSAAAKAQGICVNVADDPEFCTFIVPAQVHRGDLTLAISTGGASPALARKPIEKGEPLAIELGAFVDSVAKARQPKVGAALGKSALEVAIAITEQIRAAHHDQ